MSISSRKNLRSVYRDCSCACINKSYEGRLLRICGWIHRKRHHGGLLFIDLRDNYGVTQCVIEPENKEFSVLVSMPLESVISVYGKIIKRPLESYNSNLASGEVELCIVSLKVLSNALELPFPISSETEYPEEIRLSNRFLDLRRSRIHSNILKRSEIISSIRRLMLARGFTEFQTPILTASSPEGARDYLVPSRLHAGKFYALPQAPQQFKQLLMISGFDRYFQIAPCFRDEDARSDRSPGEFYQLDIEMSFVEQKDVFELLEPVLIELFKEHSEYPVSDKFTQLTYKEAMHLYSTDKPDLRNPIKLCDLTDLFISPKVSFRAFRDVIEKGGIVRGIPAPLSASKPRSFFDQLNEWAKKEMGSAGLGYIICSSSQGKLVGKGPIARFVPDEIWQKIVKRAGLNEGDSIFFVCDQSDNAHLVANAARNKIADKLDIIKKKSFEFCWIVDFPMYEKTDQPPSGKGNIGFSHNPFSMPQGGMEALENKHPLDILGYQYDVVCNGIELSSGAIRNHRVDILYKAFEIAGYEKEFVEKNFQGMLRALSYGSPPHGGIAPGLDRIVMLLTGESNLREIIAFPLNQQAQDLLMGAPGEVSEAQLKTLGLSIRKQKKL